MPKRQVSVPKREVCVPKRQVYMPKRQQLGLRGAETATFKKVPKWGVTIQIYFFFLGGGLEINDLKLIYLLVKTAFRLIVKCTL